MFGFYENVLKRSLCFCLCKRPPVLKIAIKHRSYEFGFVQNVLRMTSMFHQQRIVCTPLLIIVTVITYVVVSFSCVTYTLPKTSYSIEVIYVEVRLADSQFAKQSLPFMNLVSLLCCIIKHTHSHSSFHPPSLSLSDACDGTLMTTSYSLEIIISHPSRLLGCFNMSKVFFTNELRR